MNPSPTFGVADIPYAGFLIALAFQAAFVLVIIHLWLVNAEVHRAAPPKSKSLA